MKTQIALAFTAALLVAGSAAAADATPPPRVITVEKTATGGAIVKVDGGLFAEYIVDRANKTFLWPVIGPTGKAMTRGFPQAPVAGETVDHVHQRGLLFGHQSVNAFDTWAEDASYREHSNGMNRLATLGAIRHRGYKSLSGGATGVIHARSDFVDPQNKPILAEERRMTFSVAGDTRVIDVDIDLIAAYGPVKLEDMKDAGLAIRVPDSMAVDGGQGGVIVNSAGERNSAAWSKHATWVDYHGPVEGEHLGISILNHPSSFRHPTAWHVRTYGLFCANPFGLKQMNPEAQSGAVDLATGDRIRLRHRFIFHRGNEQEAEIAAAYAAYAADPLSPLE